jgi:putative transcriptional regulator
MEITITIDELMREKGILVVDLARKIGITPANLSNIKNGKISAIRLQTLAALCREIKCQPGDFIRYEQEKEKKNVIPMFLDYTGTMDLLLTGGAEKVKEFFDSVINLQEKTEIELQIFMVTGSSFESARSKFKLLADLAENYGLNNLFEGVVAEYCGFLIKKDGSQNLIPLDNHILEKKADIEAIIGEFGGKINPSNNSYYNTVFDNISRADLDMVAEKIEKLMEESTGDTSIGTVTYYDDYGKECDIKPESHTKSKAVLMIYEQLCKKYNVPLAIIGGDSQEEDLKMYTDNKENFEKHGIKSIFIAPANIGEISNRRDRNIIIGDWENAAGITQGIEKLTSTIRVREDGGIEL